MATNDNDKKMNPDRFRFIPMQKAQPVVIPKKGYPRQTTPFLRGPVPVWWLSQAGKLRGKALAAGVALWYQSGLTKKNPVKATRKLWGKFEINRKSASRGVRSLEGAGLITVVRRPGCAPVITIVNEQSVNEADVAA